MRNTAAIALFLVALGLVACGGSSEPSNADRGSANSEPTTVRGTAKPPTVRVPDGPPPKQLIVEDIRRGSGTAIPPRARLGISVLYVASSYETGKPYEVEWNPNRPFDIEFGPGLVIKGWERGLVGMRVGGRRKLIVPSRLAYGQGATVFVIELLGVTGLDTDSGAEPEQVKKSNPPQASSSAVGPGVKLEPAPRGRRPWRRRHRGPAPKEIVVRDLKEGSGPGAEDGDELWLHYAAFEYWSGEEIESSWVLTYKFELGSEYANEGWERGLVGMKAGGRRELIVPDRYVAVEEPETFVVVLVAIK